MTDLMPVYVKFQNTNDDDVTLYKFMNMQRFIDYFHTYVTMNEEFEATNLIDQTGMVMGFPEVDYSIPDEAGE